MSLARGVDRETNVYLSAGGGLSEGRVRRRIASEKAAVGQLVDSLVQIENIAADMSVGALTLDGEIDSVNQAAQTMRRRKELAAPGCIDLVAGTSWRTHRANA